MALAGKSAGHSMVGVVACTVACMAVKASSPTMRLPMLSWPWRVA